MNTDLDLVASFSLAPLATALEACRVSPLDVTHSGDSLWYSTFETDELYEAPDPNIASMLEVVESLSADHRAIWDKCDKREFNVGYSCGEEPRMFNQGLTNATLLRMANVGASFRITLYPRRAPESDDDAP